MIVVTAPTGQIGSRVTAHLLADDAAVRVVVRDPARLPAAVRDRVDVVTGSHRDPDVLAKALDGAESVFWLVAADHRAATVEEAFGGFARAAAEAFTGGTVARVVGISALGRGTAAAARAGHVTASLAMDDRIAATGVHYRALAMPSFMDNVLRQADRIRDEGVFGWPGSLDRRVPTCAVRDIAAVAFGLLRDDSWTGVEEVPVLGPEDLTPRDLVRIMSEVLGRPVRAERISAEAYGAMMAARGMSGGMAAAMVEMMTAKDAGLDNAVPRTPATRTPTTFRRWCTETLLPALAR